MCVSSFLYSARDWEIPVDLKGKAKYLNAIRESGMPPDIILSSRLTKQVVLLELTIPWVSRIEELYAFKLAEYTELG